MINSYMNAQIQVLCEKKKQVRVETRDCWETEVVGINVLPREKKG